MITIKTDISMVFGVSIAALTIKMVGLIQIMVTIGLIHHGVIKFLMMDTLQM